MSDVSFPTADDYTGINVPINTVTLKKDDKCAACGRVMAKGTTVVTDGVPGEGNGDGEWMYLCGNDHRRLFDLFYRTVRLKNAGTPLDEGQRWLLQRMGVEVLARSDSAD